MKTIKELLIEDVQWDKFIQRYWAATERGSITYKKQRFPLANGMDEGDFVWDLLQLNGVKV